MKDCMSFELFVKFYKFNQSKSVFHARFLNIIYYVILEENHQFLKEIIKLYVRRDRS